MPSNWRPPLSVSEKATIEELRFVFDQATKRAEQTSEEGDRLYNKSINIIVVCLPLLSALIGYIISHFSLNALTILASLSAIVLLIVVSVLKNSVMPTRYLGSGSYPKDLLTESFYENLNNKTTEWYFIMNETIMYQERIEINVQNNTDRNSRLKDCFMFLYSLPLLLILASVMLYFFS